MICQIDDGKGRWIGDVRGRYPGDLSVGEVKDVGTTRPHHLNSNINSHPNIEPMIDRVHSLFKLTPSSTSGSKNEWMGTDLDSSKIAVIIVGYHHRRILVHTKPLS